MRSAGWQPSPTLPAVLPLGRGYGRTDRRCRSSPAWPASPRSASCDANQCRIRRTGLCSLRWDPNRGVTRLAVLTCRGPPVGSMGHSWAPRSASWRRHHCFSAFNPHGRAAMTHGLDIQCIMFQRVLACSVKCHACAGHHALMSVASPRGQMHIICWTKPYRNRVRASMTADRMISSVA